MGDFFSTLERIISESKELFLQFSTERLEGVISEDQLEVIRLAFIGVGIRFEGGGWWSCDELDGHPSTDDDIPLSFARLCSELTTSSNSDIFEWPWLLYVALLGVGVDISSLDGAGFDILRSVMLVESDHILSDAEIIEVVRTENPKFSVLLAVGNMVMSMSDSEYKQFLSSQIHHNVSYYSRCNAVAYSKLYDDIASYHFPADCSLSEFLHNCEFEYASYVDDYFDSLIQKIKAQRALQKGMVEGYVSLNNIKMVICGPPFVGKTAFKCLLLNKPPPLKHNSTPITARPIQAIERIAAGDNIWEEVSEEDLLHMLLDAIENKTTQSLHKEYGLENTPSSLLEDVSATTNSAPLVASPSVAGGNTLSEVLHEAIRSDIDKNSTYSISEIDSLKNKSLEDVPVATNFASVVASLLAEKAFLHVKATDYVSRKIINQLSLSNERKGSQKLLEATWIHLLDSGGQPQFIDLLHMFMRDNSLYIIVMKVTESLHDKPIFVYSLNGSRLSIPQKMTMTNLQIIESFVHSVAVASRYKTTKPAFAIVATNCDRSKFRRFIGLDEKLNAKNKVLQECLSEFLDLFIFYNHDSNELIFPVNNLCLQNRDKISADIRSRLLCFRSDISFNVKIPIRWYLFDLNMKKEASKETHGIISLESCFNIGNNFGMDESEVKHCLNYLDSMRLCIYYPNIIPRVVFTSPQFLIDCLSNIARVSFIDDLQQILPEGVSLPHETVQSLIKDGVFDESLLDNLGLTFLPNLFSKSDLLSLLQHFRLISPIKAAHDVHQYFIPVLLPAERLTKEQKAIFGSSLDPLIITFKGQLVLQVSN